MRLIRSLFFLAMIGGCALLAYNYYNGRGLTFQLPANAAREAEPLAERGAALAGTATEKAKEAASSLGAAVDEGRLTAKIKSKMALDDHVDAARISVETNGTVVTLTGTVGSEAEHARALALAKETAGVTQVVDKLAISK